jgi:hypothetical protein
MMDIPNYNGKYEIDEFGNVYSKAKGRLLKPSKSVKGYMVLNLNKKSRPLHQLIAESFIDSNYKSKGLVVDHIDRNKTNNELSNLRLVSKKDNYINSDYYENRRKGHIHIRSSGNFRAIISINGTRYDKTFKSELEAQDYINTKATTI